MLLTEYDEKKHWKHVREEGREEGLAEGRKAVVAIAKKLVRNNRYTVTEISELTGLSEDEIEA